MHTMKFPRKSDIFNTRNFIRELLCYVYKNILWCWKRKFIYCW